MALPQEETFKPTQYTPPAPLSMVMSAAYNTSELDITEVMAWAKHDAYKDLNERGGTMLQPEELSKKFPGSTFSDPMTELAAYNKVDDEEFRRKNNAILESGNTGFLSGTVLPFVSSMGAVLMDPIGFAVNAATAGLGKWATAGKMASAGVATKLGAAVLEDIVGNAISEGIVYQGTKAEQQEYTAEQMFHNVVSSSLVFNAGKAGLGKAIKKLGGVTMDKIYGKVEIDLENGKDISKSINDLLAYSEKDIEMDPTFSTTFKESLPGLELKEGDSLKDGFDKMFKALDDDVIDQVQADDFIKRLREAGFEERKIEGYSQDNHTTKFDSDFIAEQNKSVTSNQSDWGYDAKAEAEFKAAPDRVEPKSLDTELAKATEALEPIKDIDNISAKNTDFVANYKEAVEGFVGCELGA